MSVGHVRGDYVFIWVVLLRRECGSCTWGCRSDWEDPESMWGKEEKPGLAFWGRWTCRRSAEKQVLAKEGRESQGWEEAQKSGMPPRPRAQRESTRPSTVSLGWITGKSGKGPCGFSNEKVTDELLLLYKHWEGLFFSGLYFYLGFKLSVIGVRIPRVISF